MSKTIIECLKYATTGDMPPNSKGGAFIHDPKLCNEREVLAQVRLQFKSTSGAKMVATRNIQLIVKKATRQMKTLEGQLLMVKDGERTAISTRVAELDQIMPQYLGVSKAILDSVIFCHQDESLWPLSEPSALKKRFDEIFEALKYTKAVDNIKVLRKKQNEELSKLRIVEQHAKEDKDRGDRAEKRSNELYVEIESLRAQSGDLEVMIQDASTKASQAWDKAAHFGLVVGKLEGKRIEAAAKTQSIADLKDDITEMQESDEELEVIQSRYEERVHLYREEMQSERRRYADLGRTLESTRRSLSEKQNDLGRFQAEKDHFDRQVATRETLIRETARRHDVRGFDLELTDERVRDFIERMSRMVREHAAAFEKVRREMQDESEKAQYRLNELNLRKSSLTQAKDNAKASITANERRISQLQQSLSEIRVDEGAQASLEAQLHDTESQLQKAKKEFESSAWDDRIQAASSSVRSLEEQKDTLDAEILKGTKQATESARLDLLRKEITDRQNSLSTMLGAHSTKLRTFLGDDWTSSTLDARYQDVLARKSAEMKETELRREGVARELEALDFKLVSVQDSLKQKRQELHHCEALVRNAIEDHPEQFPDVLRDLESSRDQRKGDVDSFDTRRGFFKECLETLKEHNICRLCTRRFTEKQQQDRQGYEARLQKYLSDAAQQAAMDELESLESELRKAREASVSYERWRSLSHGEIATLEVEEKALATQREKLILRLEQQDSRVHEMVNSKRDIESFARTIQTIAKYDSEITTFELQLAELVQRQSQTGRLRAPEEVREQISSVNENLKNSKSVLSRLKDEREHALTRINQLELDVRDVKAKVNNAAFQLEKKASITTQIEEVNNFNQSARDQQKDSEASINEVLPLIAQAQAAYEEVNGRFAVREKDLREEKNALESSLALLRTADRDVSSYIDRGGPQQVSRANREIDHIENELARVEIERGHVTVSINKLDEQLRSHNETKRSITLNLRYRRDSRALQAVLTEIKDLESHNADVDKDRWEQEGRKWQTERSKLAAEQASLMGALKSKDDALKQLLKDWETDYKDAGLKYKEAHIKVEATKAAVEDLGRYGSALDKAIMKYHSLKMEEINRIIEELWRKTYQGTDVDSIVIRSDSEGAKGNKSYNYRVCMIKQEAEMDMRGRCSAGQKVLASIIIRLALAECFGVNCGLIALDEPTTNLDRENIRALAESLHEIIKARRQQSNFQLIVITHDEEFLREMQCADFADEYYRVSRNDRQKSIIEKQSIAQVL